MLTKQHRQEALSRAYVQAVAAACGLGYNPRATDYGIDCSLNEILERGKRRVEGGLQLDLQLKSTTAASVGPTQVSYDLDVKSYEDLRDDGPRVRRILVVYVLPEAEAEWVAWSEEHLLLRHSAYWFSLRGRPAVKNTRTVRVPIPRENQFSPEGVLAIMKRLREGEP